MNELITQQEAVVKVSEDAFIKDFINDCHYVYLKNLNADNTDSGKYRKR